jgi:tetratricopeptide (TPR) repeat protein
MDKNQIYKKIEDYAYGRLSSAEVEDLWVKILEDPELLSYLETVAHLRQLSSSESKASTPKRAKVGNSILRKSFLAIAACLVITVGVLYYFQLTTKSPMPKGQVLIPSSDYESVDVFRSVDSNLTSHQKELNKGFAMMIRHQDDQAKSVFKHLLALKPKNELQAKLFFDLGAIAYNRRHYTTALDDFRLALSHTNNGINEWLPEKINWYLGQTHLQLKQQEKTVDYVERVIKYNGYYHSRAESLLTKLNK